MNQRWKKLECCLELVEGGEEGKGTRRMEEKTGREESGPEETAPRGSSSSSTPTSKNVERLETLETELETIHLTEDNDDTTEKF